MLCILSFSILQCHFTGEELVFFNLKRCVRDKYNRCELYMQQFLLLVLFYPEGAWKEPSARKTEHQI